jgi:hypothetical protein
VNRFLIAPGLVARRSAQRIGRGVDRRQADHLGREAGIGFERPACVAPPVTSSAIMWTGTRVPRNTGSPPRRSGSLTTRRRARRNSRSDIASSRRGSRRSILTSPPSRDRPGCGLYTLQAFRRMQTTRWLSNPPMRSTEIRGTARVWLAAPPLPMDAGSKFGGSCSSSSTQPP